jgi:hypothetical protein
MSQMVERESGETFCQMAAGTSFANLQTNGYWERTRVVRPPPPPVSRVPKIILRKGRTAAKGAPMRTRGRRDVARGRHLSNGEAVGARTPVRRRHGMVGTIALMVVLAVGMALLALPRLLNLRAQTEMDQSIKVVEDLRADSSAMQGRSDEPRCRLAVPESVQPGRSRRRGPPGQRPLGLLHFLRGLPRDRASRWPGWQHQDSRDGR